ncbi:MAG TPA: NAD-binding protein, partial [Cryomorphaceae bacterium]|nr:NAD-binding protein [Cryomorphaceae bacterium]
FFFVSIGMLLDLNFLVMNLPLVLLFTVFAALVKFGVLVLAARVLKFSLKTGILVGLSLFQVGEFAFILSRTGMDAGLISELTNQYFLSVSILTMGATPFLIDYGERIANFLMRTPMNRLARRNHQPESLQSIDKTDKLTAHLVIIGYGTNGRNAARTAKEAKIPYVIIDNDAETVTAARAKGEHIIFGDGSNPFILEYVHIYRARVAVVAIPDHQKAMGVIANIREICNTVHIIARSQSIPETEELLHLGASEAISQEFEASVEVFARMLNQFLIKPEEIDGYIDMVRDEAYSEIHSNYHYYKKDALELNDIEALSIVLSHSCPFTGKNLCETPLMEKYKVRLIGFYRNGNFISKMDGATRLHEGDEIIVFGSENDLKGFKAEWTERTVMGSLSEN